MTGPPPKVFISYCHDTVEHQKRVLGLADRLRADGIDAEIDQYNAAPPHGWPLWCERQIKTADIVLMVCTETYHRRVSGDEDRGNGSGVVWEARIIRQLLYDAGAVSDKFVPVLFSDNSPEQIPTPIKGWSRYVVDTEDGYEDLYRRLTGQPRLPRPELGPIRKLPTRRRQWSEGAMEAASSSLHPREMAEGRGRMEPVSGNQKADMDEKTAQGQSGGVNMVGSVTGDILLRKMGEELKRLKDIDRAALRRTKDCSCPRETIFGKSSSLKDATKWCGPMKISAQEILSDWFKLETLKGKKRIEKRWKDIFTRETDNDKVYLWKGTHDIVEVNGHPYISRMYPHIIVGRAIHKDVSEILLQFCNWLSEFQEYSKGQKGFGFCIPNIFLSYPCAYFESEITFKNIVLTSQEKRWNETVLDYKLTRKIIIVQSGSYVYTVVTGVPHEEDYNKEYIHHVDEWLSNFQIGSDNPPRF